MIVDLSLVKAHLRLDDDANEDSLITAYQSAAEEAAAAYLNRSVYATQTEVDAAIVAGEDRPMLSNPSFVMAVLQAVGAAYAQREDTASPQSEFPQASRRLLDPFRVGQGV